MTKKTTKTKRPARPEAAPIKILAVREPWAHLIINGKKDIENRIRRTHYRGRLAILASKAKAPQSELDYARKKYGVEIDANALTYSEIIGSVDLVDCVETHKSRWFQGPFGYVLTNRRPYAKPIPAKGQLGIFARPELMAKLRSQEK